MGPKFTKALAYWFKASYMYVMYLWCVVCYHKQQPNKILFSLLIIWAIYQLGIGNKKSAGGIGFCMLNYSVTLKNFYKQTVRNNANIIHKSIIKVFFYFWNITDISTNRNKSMELKASKCINNLYSNASTILKGKEELSPYHAINKILNNMLYQTVRQQSLKNIKKYVYLLLKVLPTSVKSTSTSSYVLRMWLNKKEESVERRVCSYVALCVTKREENTHYSCYKNQSYYS